jgi:hypothetical protein
LSLEILTHVIDQDTTVVAWSTLTSMFSSSSKSKASHLRAALNNTKKKDMTDAWLMTSRLGTPRGRCDEYSSKIFPQLRNQGLSFRRGETNN